MLTLDDINYQLPEELIASQPLANRSASRLLAVSKRDQTIRDDCFSSISEYIHPGDCLVMNDTRVFKARLHGTDEKGRTVELLLTDRIDETRWKTLLKNSKKFQPGTRVRFSGVSAVIQEKEEEIRYLQFEKPMAFSDINQIGEVPLPPYIIKKRKNHGLPNYEQTDEERYQSVMAKYDGSVAAPTASLHFTEDILEELKAKGVKIALVTLHVGPGTFKPIDTDSIEEFKIHFENAEVNKETVDLLKLTKRGGGRVIAVGTTVVRALETMALDKPDHETWAPICRATDIFIKGEFHFNAVNALITNFHMPKSTLLLLVYSFGGTELLKRAYQQALELKYRFLSYGDAMIIY